VCIHVLGLAILDGHGDGGSKDTNENDHHDGGDRVLRGRLPAARAGCIVERTDTAGACEFHINESVPAAAI